MSKIFVDTNILMYALHSSNAKVKTEARSRLRQLQKADEGVISTQIMQEFYVVATRKLGVDPILVKRILRQFENFEVVTIVPSLIYEAIDCGVTEQISFWDALVVVAAQSARCDTLWSQDLNTGQTIRDVTVLNPLTM